MMGVGGETLGVVGVAGCTNGTGMVVVSAESGLGASEPRSGDSSDVLLLAGPAPPLPRRDSTGIGDPSDGRKMGS